MELVDAVREFREFGAIFSNSAPSVRHVKPHVAISPRVSSVLYVLRSFLRRSPCYFRVPGSRDIYTFHNTFSSPLFFSSPEFCPRLWSSITFRVPLRVHCSPWISSLALYIRAHKRSFTLPSSLMFFSKCSCYCWMRFQNLDDSACTYYIDFARYDWSCCGETTWMESNSVTWDNN